MRIVQDVQNLNTLLKSQSSGLGGAFVIFDHMGESTGFTCLDLASGFLQLKTDVVDCHLTTFRDANEKLWKYVRCRFELKTVPSVFPNYVGCCLMLVKRFYVREWLNDILVPSRTVAKSWGLLCKMFGCARTDRLSVILQNYQFCVPEVEWLGTTIDSTGSLSGPNQDRRRHSTIEVEDGGGR